MLLPLALIWIGIGLIAGLLAHAAKLGFAARGMAGRSALLWTLALGAVRRCSARSFHAAAWAALRHADGDLGEHPGGRPRPLVLAAGEE